MSKVKKFNVEELRKKSLEARQSQDKEKDFEGAYQEAFEKVIEKAEEKIEQAMSEGKFRAYLYIWHYVNDKNDRRFTFKNVRMFDIVTKGDLMERLRKHFNGNSESEDGLFVSWHKFPNVSKGSTRSRYGIFVSWAKKKEDNDEEQDDDEKERQSKKKD